MRTQHPMLNRSGTLLRGLLWCPCLLLAGCQVPVARPEAGPTVPEDSSRGGVLVRQVLGDTALEMSTSPLQTTAQLAGGVVAEFARAGREVFAKRCFIPLHGPPPPLAEERPALDPAGLE